MAEHIQSELAARYLLRSLLFWRKVRDSRFGEWQKRARSAAWKNVVWNWSELGISDSEAAKALEQILASYAAEKCLVDEDATATLNKTKRGLVFKSGTLLLFGSEPDVECRYKAGQLICVIEIKGSADKAGAQTRLGETKKSFSKAKQENPRCHTIFLPSVLTPAVEAQLKSEREIDQVFYLLAILKDEAKRTEFLEELFKFHLRENI